MEKISASALSCLLCAWLQTICVSVDAQTNHSEEKSFGQALVVGLRGSEEAQSPVLSQRIDTAAFLRQGITSTADALRRLGGINLRDYGGAGGLKTVSVRGMGAAHTAVIYDGLPVSDLRSGQVDLSCFHLQQLSSLSLTIADENALLCPVRQLGAATLSLHSLLPDTASLRHHLSTSALKTTAALTHAAFNTWNPSLRTTYRPSARQALNVGGNFYFAENDYPYLLRNGVLTHTEHRKNSRMSDWDAEANHLFLLKGGGVWRTKIHYADNHRRLPGAVLFYSNDNHERLTDRTAFLQTRMDAGKNVWKYFFAGKFSWNENRYSNLDAQYPGGALKQNYWQREWYASGGVQWAQNGWAAAFAGDYSFTALHSNQTTDNRVRRHTLQGALSLRYAVQRFSATARLVGTALSNDAPDNTESADDASRLTPSLSLSWQVVRSARTHLFLRAHYQERFRAPTFNENYYFHYGNTHLRPERTRQWGWGTSLESAPAGWLPSLLFTADAYVNRITDKISSVPASLYLWRSLNLGLVRAVGADFTLRADFRLALRSHLLLSGNYSYLRCVDRTSSTSNSYNKQLAYTPEHSGAVSMAWENPLVNVSTSLTAAAARWTNNEHAQTTRLPGYAEVGLGAYKRLCFRQANCLLRADVLNLFDRQYEVIGRYPMPGRSYRLSVEINF